jgi:xylulokinase
MYLLSLDIGTSSIKVSVVDASTQKCVATSQYPGEESLIISEKPGYTEQDPLLWCYNAHLPLLAVMLRTHTIIRNDN